MGGIVRVKGKGEVLHTPFVATDSVADWEARWADHNEKVPVAALFDKDGKQIDQMLGENKHFNVDTDDLATKDGTLTYIYPDRDLSGSFGFSALRALAGSELKEIRSIDQQNGKVYILRAKEGADRKGLRSWANSNRSLIMKNFRNSYKKALKDATEPLKGGKHKGMVKLVGPSIKDPVTGKKKQGKVVYVKPMTPRQAQAYARQYSVGLFDRTYAKNLSKLGFEYISTKAGKNARK